MRSVITLGTSLREYCDQLDGAKAALEHVLSLMQRRYPNVRVFDEDGRKLSLDDLRRQAPEESRADLPILASTHAGSRRRAPEF
jgi:hypothetical protein